VTALHNACRPFAASALVNDLRLAGVSLVARAGKIHWRRVSGTITPDQADQLRQHRAEVLAHLEMEGPDHEQRPGADGLPPWASWADHWAVQAIKL
jgi:hypothetical protein